MMRINNLAAALQTMFVKHFDYFIFIAHPTLESQSIPFFYFFHTICLVCRAANNLFTSISLLRVNEVRMSIWTITLLYRFVRICRLGKYSRVRLGEYMCWIFMIFKRWAVFFSSSILLYLLYPSSDSFQWYTRQITHAIRQFPNDLVFFFSSFKLRGKKSIHTI